MIRLACRMGLVEIGQAELTFLAVVIGQETIHRGVRGIGSEYQIRPLDCFVFVTVPHQPACRLTAELRVERIAEQIAADLAEPRLVVLESLDDLELGARLGLFPQPGKHQHALVARPLIEGVGFYCLVEVTERRFEVALVQLERRAGGQHLGITGRQGQRLFEQAGRLGKITNFQGCFARASPRYPKGSRGLRAR